jgi:hypothetical protein
MTEIYDIEGMVVDSDLSYAVARELVDLAFRLQQFNDGLQHAASVLDRRSSRLVTTAMSALGMAATALFAAADTKCTQGGTEADVRTRPEGPNHDMITRCEHDPAHCWNGVGSSIKCP